MCLNTYELNQTNDIYLYGINSYAKGQLEMLDKAGYNVKALIDQRAGEAEEYCGCSVVNKAVFLEVNQNNSNAVVVIMLQNAMQHDNLALEFMKNGISKVLFVPMNGLVHRKYAAKLRHDYNRFLFGQYGLLQDLLCVQDVLYEKKWGDLGTLIQRDEDMLTAWVPVELLYTNPLEAVKGKKAQEEYSDIPIGAYKPYVDMIRYIEHGEGDMQQYLKEYGVNSCGYRNLFDDKTVLLQRKRLLDIYHTELNYGMDFFISSAPLVKWNDRGFFNLMEGQHRSIWLMLNGIRRIPVRMDNEDYSKWGNESSASKLYSYLLDEAVECLTAPFSNPFLRGFPANDEMLVEKKLLTIQEYLGVKMLKGKRILDISPYQGYFGRNAVRMGAQNVTILEIAHKELIELLNASASMEDIEVVSAQNQITKDVDIIFAFGKVEIDYIYELLPRCKEMLFVDINMENEKDTIFNYMKSKTFIYLGTEINERGLSKYGVFVDG